MDFVLEAGEEDGKVPHPKGEEGAEAEDNAITYALGEDGLSHGAVRSDSSDFLKSESEKDDVGTISELAYTVRPTCTLSTPFRPSSWLAGGNGGRR